MIIKLMPEQISVYWDMIKHGVVVANKLTGPNQDSVPAKLLERLLVGKAQCWLGMTEDEQGFRTHYAFGITTVEESSIGEVYLFLHTLYAFRPMPESLVEEILPTLEDFAKGNGCSKLVTFTANARLITLYTTNGFKQDPMLFIKNLEEV